MHENILQVTVYTKQDFSDEQIIDFLLNNPNITPKDYSEFLKNKNYNSQLAEKILTFISNYENGFLKPDMCDAYEPIREKFDERNLRKPIRWLSQPGSAFYFKKLNGSKVEGVFENLRPMLMWDDEKRIPPKDPDPFYKGEVKLYFRESLKKTKNLLWFEKLMNEIYNTIKGDIALFTTNDEFENYHLDKIYDKKIIVSDAVISIFRV